MEDNSNRFSGRAYSRDEFARLVRENAELKNQIKDVISLMEKSKNFLKFRQMTIIAVCAEKFVQLNKQGAPHDTIKACFYELEAKIKAAKKTNGDVS